MAERDGADGEARKLRSTVRNRDCVLEPVDEVCGWTKGKCRNGEM